MTIIVTKPFLMFSSPSYETSPIYRGRSYTLHHPSKENKASLKEIMTLERVKKGASLFQRSALDEARELFSDNDINENFQGAKEDTKILGRLKKRLSKRFSRILPFTSTQEEESSQSVERTTNKVSSSKDQVENQVEVDTKDWIKEIIHESYMSWLTSHLKNKTEEEIEKDIAPFAKILFKKISKRFVEYSKEMTGEEVKEKVGNYARKYIQEYQERLQAGTLKKKASTQAALFAKASTNGVTLEDIKRYNDQIRQRTLKKKR